MKTFIFLDTLQQQLAPLTDEYCIAMLPIAGKPLIAYAVEEVARAGLQDAVIVASSGAREVADFLGKGERWGMHFEYFPCRLQEHPAAVVGRYGNIADTQTLVLKGDVLLAGIGNFLERAAALPGATIVAGIEGRAVGLTLFRGDLTELDSFPWPGAEHKENSQPDHWLTLDSELYCPIYTLADFHRASLRMAEGDFGSFKLAGWEHQPGFISGQGSSVDHNSVAAEHCYVGKGCHIHGSAKLRGTVVVNDNCFVDSGALIENSVILPATYIGSNLDVSNALVHGSQIIRIDTGASYAITDPFLLASMNSGGLRGWLTSIGNRCLGLLLLLLSLPLWPIAASIALLRSPQSPFFAEQYYSNRLVFDAVTGWSPRAFSGWQFSVSQPLLRSLPLLFAVVQGHANVLGARLRRVDAQSSLQQPWEDAVCLTSSGLLGPSQLVLPAHAPVEEQLLSEIHFHHHRSLRGDMVYLFRGIVALFTTRAWIPRHHC
jgi:mannose-1-phosphate guanylyltransferase/phosphomannomutase